jgi:hypothetical protein
MFFRHLLTTKDTKESTLTSILSLRERRIKAGWSEETGPTRLHDNSSNSIFVSFVTFVVAFRARGANGVDDEIVLVRKDRAQVEPESSVADVTNDGRNETAKGVREILDRAVLWQKIERD